MEFSFSFSFYFGKSVTKNRASEITPVIYNNFLVSGVGEFSPFPLATPLIRPRTFWAASVYLVLNRLN